MKEMSSDPEASGARNNYKQTRPNITVCKAYKEFVILSSEPTVCLEELGFSAESTGVLSVPVMRTNGRLSTKILRNYF